MKFPKHYLRLFGPAVIVAGLSLGSALRAQTAPAVSVAAKSADAPLVLSPFVVSSDKDVGFVANSSLAGGRLADDLKNTPAAYSVQTREFLDALQITDLNEAAKWTVNSFTAQNQGTNEVFNYGTSSSSQVLFRGSPPSTTGTAQTQRDFFPYAVDFDTYNLERIDYARGPNAILFGNGDYQGGINAVSRTAQTTRNFDELKLSYGSWDNFRGTLDSNIALIKDKLALRVDALWSDRDGWRQFEFEKRKAVTLAATWEINRDTQLRVQVETGTTDRNNPLFTLNDRFTGWDGTTTYSTLFNPSDSARGTELVGAATQPDFVYLPYKGAVVNLAGQSRTVGGNNATVTQVGGVSVVGPSAGLSGNPFNGGLGLPASLFTTALAGSRFTVPGRDFGVASDNPSFMQNYHGVSAFLTHKFTNNLYGSIDANKSGERRTTEYTNTRGLVFTYLDVNAKLPDGSANPEFLQPYNEGVRNAIKLGNDIQSIRASLAYLLERTRFGSFSFNGSWQHTETNFNSDPRFYGVKRDADHRNWSRPGSNNLVMEPDGIYYRFYWDQPNRATPLPTSVTDAATGSTYQAGWIKQINGGGTISYVKLNTLQLAGKAKLFNDRIHLLGAFRHDDYTQHVLNGKVRGDYPVDWDGSTFMWRPDAPADYGTLVYTPKNAAGVATGAPRPAISRPRAANGVDRLPQYAGDRFQDDFGSPDVKVKQNTYTLGGVGYLTKGKTLSAYYNYATTFNPSPARQNIFGNFYGPQTASEWSVGLRKSFLDDRVNVSLDYYKGRQIGQVFDQGSGPGDNINTIVFSTPTGAAPGTSGNQRGLAATPREFDTRDLNNHGYELEITANPTREWRVSFNAALPKSQVSNIAPDYIRYFNTNVATLKQILADDSVLVDATTNRAAVNPAVASPTADAVGAANAWNNIQNNLPNIGNLTQVALGAPKYSLNLFTDYTFSHGPLKSFSIGGGVNYRGRFVVGYRGADTIVNPANPAASIDDPTVDGTTPVYVDGYTTATVVFSYTYRFLDKHPIQLSLKIDNLFDYAQPVYSGTVQRAPGGVLSNPSRVATPAQYYYLTPRNFTLTATYKF